MATGLESARRATRRINEYFGTDSIAYSSERRRREARLTDEVAALRRDVDRLAERVERLTERDKK